MKTCLLCFVVLLTIQASHSAPGFGFPDLPVGLPPLPAGGLPPLPGGVPSLPGGVPPLPTGGIPQLPVDPTKLAAGVPPLPVDPTKLAAGGVPKLPNLPAGVPPVPGTDKLGDLTKAAPIPSFPIAGVGLPGR